MAFGSAFGAPGARAWVFKAVVTELEPVPRSLVGGIVCLTISSPFSGSRHFQLYLLETNK